MPNTSHSGLNSYLMGKTKVVDEYFATICKSMDCLFDGYLIGPKDHHHKCVNLSMEKAESHI